MRKYNIAFLSVLLGFVAFAGEPVKVMTYNVHNGIGLDKMTDYERIGKRIAAEMPDFVAIQEVDSATVRSKGA